MQTASRAPNESNIIRDSSSVEFWDAIGSIAKDVLWLSSLHTEYTITYFRLQSDEEQLSSEDRSFILVWDGKPLIGFIASMVERSGRRDLIAYKVPCTVIEDTRRNTDKATKTFIKLFDELVKDINGEVHIRDFLVDGTVSSLSQHLLRQGASVSPAFSQVIDLGQDETRLKSRLRKSYRSLINWGMRELDPQVLSGSEMTWEHMIEFRDLHIRVAGKETRSEDTWRRQFEAVQRNQGFVVRGFQDGELVTAGLFSHNKHNCYYSTSASRRDLFDKPLFHALMWTAMLHAKKIGKSWLELGDLPHFSNPVSEDISEKEISIMDFKAGFGGDTRVSLDIAWTPSDQDHGK